MKHLMFGAALINICAKDVFSTKSTIFGAGIEKRCTNTFVFNICHEHVDFVRFRHILS